MIGWLLTERLRRRLRHLFPHVYIAGSHYLRPWQNGSARVPLLLYCSHDGWSDVALAVIFSRRLLRLRSLFLVHPQQFQHLRALRFLGGVVLPWDNPPAVQELLPGLVPRLLSPRTVLWVFATGAVLSTGETEALWGCADLVSSMQSPVALAPVIWSYHLLQTEPACYLFIAEPELWEPQQALSALVHRCSQRLLSLYSYQQQLLSSGSVPALYNRYRL